MTSRNENWYVRAKPGLGVWEHRGKVAVAGIGHSPTDRRWDGKTMETTLGAYSIIAAKKAMDDAGVSLDEIDGVISSFENTGEPWGPRPYFAAPYDSEDGLTRVTAEWLAKGLGLKKVKYFNSGSPHIGAMICLAAQAVGDGLCKTCLVLYPMGNVEGRYHHTDGNESAYAPGDRQWSTPWGYEGGAMVNAAYVFKEYCRKYGTSLDGLAPFAVNQRRNGLRTPWGYYSLHEPYQITLEDYLTSRWVMKPFRLLDCDRPCNAAACYLFTTAERARDMKQKPVYILNHTMLPEKRRSTISTLEEQEGWMDRLAQLMWEGSGLGPKDVDAFNPYDGFLSSPQLYMEGFQWHGVKRGEALDLYADDIRVEGSHPFMSSGGNNGCGRTRTAHLTDSIEQLRGTAGQRQIKIRCETALANVAMPGPGTASGIWMFGKYPD